MIGMYKHCKNIAISTLITGALIGFTPALQAHDRDRDDQQQYNPQSKTVRGAQEQLKDDGYYKGDVDGIDGPATRSAIRAYQRDKNLTVNGRLDRETCDRLGVRSEASRDEIRRADRRSDEVAANRRTGDADRSATEPYAPSTAAVRAAQRRLHDRGFFKGDPTGTMNAETRSAIREYQKNSNLNVTGKLDQATLSSLGVSK